MPKVQFEELLKAGVHFGHLKRKWNPSMAPYIFMEKNGIHLIDLHKTIVKMDEASAALKQIVKSRRKILFVATKKQAKQIKTARNIALLAGGLSMGSKGFSGMSNAQSGLSELNASSSSTYNSIWGKK